MYKKQQIHLNIVVYLLLTLLTFSKNLWAVEGVPFTITNGPLIWSDFESDDDLSGKGLVSGLTALAGGQQPVTFITDVPGPYTIAKVLQPHADGPVAVSEINNKAIQLSAAGPSYILFADNQALHPDRFVAEFFIKLGNGESTQTTLLQRGVFSNSWRIVYTGDGNLQLNIGESSMFLATNDLNLDDGEWHHVAFSYDAGMADGFNDSALYVDYYLKAEGEVPTQTPLTLSGDIRLGHIDDNVLNAPIQIDDFRVMAHFSIWSRDQFLFSTRADGLPLVHTNRDANETFYMSFDPQLSTDHVIYEIDSLYDSDGDPDSLSPEEQVAIVSEAVFTRSNFNFFDVNITTDYSEYTLGETLSRWGNRASAGPFPMSPLSGDVIDHEVGHAQMGNGHVAYDEMGNQHLRGHNNHHRAFTDYDFLGRPVMHFEGQVNGMPRGDIKWFSVNGSDLMSNYTNRIISRTHARDASIQTDGYRQDDYLYDASNKQGTAYSIYPYETGTWIFQGYIERMSDVDGFSFDWSGGKIKFDIRFKRGGLSNKIYYLQQTTSLDAAIRVYDNNGELVAYQNPDLAALAEAEGNISKAKLNDFSFVGNLNEGKYYVEVTSAGNYADLGEYIVTMTGSDEEVTSPLIDNVAPTIDSFTSYYWKGNHPFKVLRLVWQDADGESGYIVDRWDNNSSSWTNIGQTGANESWFVDETIDQTTPGEYRYRVTPTYIDAYGNNQQGASAEYARFAPIAEFTAIDSNDQVIFELE